jgi:class 3 adenylate cyclase
MHDITDPTSPAAPADGDRHDSGGDVLRRLTGLARGWLPSPPVAASDEVGGLLDCELETFDNGLDLVDGSQAGSLATPDQLDEFGPARVGRAFAFVDLSGFSRYCENRGDHHAVQALSDFRARARESTARRGLRVAKWLGDGVMFVGVDTPSLVAATVELVDRWDDPALPARAGVTAGPVLVFEGDDYLGTTINLAARLCDQAGPGQVLAELDAARDLPEWIGITSLGRRRVRGVGSFPIVSLTSLAP